jgi:AAA ATPase domain
MDLLEREAELAAIEEGLDAAAGATGAVLALEGPAGIGKSRLLAATRERAHARAVTFLEARASDLERDHAFGVVRQLFETLVLRSGAADRDDLLGGPAAPAGAVFDQPSGSPPMGAEVSFATLHGLFWLAANAAERRPLALAVDDAQSCDRPSLDWLGYLARRIDGLPVVLVVAFRPLAGGEHRPLAELAAVANLQLRPRALSAGAASALLRAALGSPVDAEFAAACQDLSGGNPLLLTEIARALASEGVPPRAAQRDRLRELAPHAVSDAVKGRLARLPDSVAAPGGWRNSTKRRRWPRPTSSSAPRSCAPASRPASCTPSSATPSTRRWVSPSATRCTCGRRGCWPTTTLTPSELPGNCYERRPPLAATSRACWARRHRARWRAARRRAPSPTSPVPSPSRRRPTTGRGCAPGSDPCACSRAILPAPSHISATRSPGSATPTSGPRSRCSSGAACSCPASGAGRGGARTSRRRAAGGGP